MADETGSKVKRLNVRFKTPPREGGEMLRVVPSFQGECNHSYRISGSTIVDAHYLIREGETEVECGLCGTKLDPMFVLARLAKEETQWSRARQTYLEDMQRLNERKRTKCECCGHMTRIIR